MSDRIFNFMSNVTCFEVQIFSFSKLPMRFSIELQSFQMSNFCIKMLRISSWIWSVFNEFINFFQISWFFINSYMLNKFEVEFSVMLKFNVFTRWFSSNTMTTFWFLRGLWANWTALLRFFISLTMLTGMKILIDSFD